MEVAAQHGFDVSGLEFSQSAVAAAVPHISIGFNRRALKRSVTISAFDVVTAFDLIEHVHDPVKFARNAGEILKPGGILALSTPDACHVLRSLMGSHWPMLQPMQHLSIFSYRSLGYVMEKAGLRVIAARPAFKTITIGYLVDQLRTLTPSLHSGLKLILKRFRTALLTGTGG